ncbi:hypothetical protein H312_02320 [Anncaliia algerae PRA339]|uniref:Sm protein B n=1 Tax=Anncaliia algerae PRA339 TaxID=1288291 RepID=A0A059EZX9_9MICR|nr:hypothetical protein H312_02320 [Anncaliia algerae PRA339]
MKKTIKKLINNRVILHCKEGRYYEGDLLSCDDDMNIVLDDSEEFNESSRRYLGLVVFRGDYICEIEILSKKMNVN